MKSLSLLAFFAVVIGLAACGKNSDNQSTPAAAPVTYGCQAGQIYNQQYGCLNPGNCPSGAGINPQTNQCVGGATIAQATSLRWGAPLRSIARDVFEDTLRNFNGVCRQKTAEFNYYPYWGVSASLNLNPASLCSYYSQTGYLIIEGTTAASNQVFITIAGGQPSPNGAYNAYAYHPVLSYSVPAYIYDINNSAGMELRAGYSTNYFGGLTPNDQGLILRINTGRLSSSKFNVEILFQGQKFAEATVEKY